MATSPKARTVLEQIHDLIQQRQYRGALHLIDRTGQRSAPMENARGVCLLRLGDIDKAGTVFRDLVFTMGSICPNLDAPVIYCTNYVTAMFLAGSLTSGVGVLSQIRDRKHPAVQRLQAALKSWKQGLGLVQRIGCQLNAYPPKPVSLDFTPGDL